RVPDEWLEDVDVPCVRQPVGRREERHVVPQAELVRDECLAERETDDIGRVAPPACDDPTREIRTVEFSEVGRQVRDAEIEPMPADRLGPLGKHGTERLRRTLRDAELEVEAIRKPWRGGDDREVDTTE